MGFSSCFWVFQLFVQVLSNIYLTRKHYKVNQYIPHSFLLQYSTSLFLFFQNILFSYLFPLNFLFFVPRHFKARSNSFSVLVAFLASQFVIQGIHANLFVIFLKGGQVFPRFGEFAFLHAFSDVPVYESSFGVHQVKFMVQSGPSFGNGRRIAQHADSALNFGQVTPGNDCRWLVIYSDLNINGIYIAGVKYTRVFENITNKLTTVC